MKKLFKIVLIIVLAFALGMGGLTLYMSSLLSKVEKGEAIAKDDAAIAEEVRNRPSLVTNIALFGADTDDQDPNSSNEHRSDAIKIVSLDYTHRKIKITSVERDLVVFMPGDVQEYGHLNWAYWYGGPKLAVQTLNYNLDLDITKYVAFSFNAVQKMVEKVEGVDVQLTDAERWQMPGELKQNSDGTYHLNGEQAMKYCRIRNIDSDFNRMDRQNNVIKAVVRHAKKLSIGELTELVNEMMPYITTNLGAVDVARYLSSLLLFDLEHIETYKAPSGEYDDIVNCPGIGGYMVKSYTAMVQEVHENIYGKVSYKVSEQCKQNEADIYATYGKWW